MPFVKGAHGGDKADLFPLSPELINQVLHPLGAFNDLHAENRYGLPDPEGEVPRRNGATRSMGTGKKVVVFRSEATSRMV